MTTTAPTAEHTCYGATFCGQPRAAAQAACPACPTTRPLVDVLAEHVDQVQAARAASPRIGSTEFTRDPSRPELHENDCPRGDADSLGTPCTCRTTGCPCECHTSGGNDDCCASAGR